MTCIWKPISKTLCRIWVPSCEKKMMTLPEGSIEQNMRNEVSDFYIFCPRCGKKIEVIDT